MIHLVQLSLSMLVSEGRIDVAWPTAVSVVFHFPKLSYITLDTFLTDHIVICLSGIG
jgi:hypothetical protein